MRETMMYEKIQEVHLQRTAVVYLRQSTLKQVHENQESTARQYALQERALELGWSREQIDVIDEDLGQSGTSTERRSGFQELTEGIGNGRVGALFALEVSRLTRSSADWHKLLHLCSLADVLIMDEQSIYNPSDHNDRLLLGLKGTMSEAEQYWMRLRLQGAKLSKARRGELYLKPALGYQWDKATSRLYLDPDEEVRRAIEFVFERFRIDRSASRVFQYFGHNKITLPWRNPKTQEMEFRQASYDQVIDILRNPVYAGAYVYGRIMKKVGLLDGKMKKYTIRRIDPNTFPVCLKNHHPAYIEWDEFMKNQRQLQSNRTNLVTPEQRGAAREGSALLQGLVLCGNCGHRMQVKYQAPHQQVQYYCIYLNSDGIYTICSTVSGTSVDPVVIELFLDSVQPPEIEVSLAVLQEAERQGKQLENQWKLRLEKLQYESLLAEKRYKAVDPENRVVARNLEREWNEKLVELQETERIRQETRRIKKIDLDEKDRLELISLAKNLRSVWLAESTSNTERKNLLRLAIQQVTLTPIDIPVRKTRIQILWQGGAVTDLIAERPNSKFGKMCTQRVLESIQKLFAAEKTDAEIAKELNQSTFKTGARRSWEASSVAYVRYQNGLLRTPGSAVGSKRNRPDDYFTMTSLADKLGVSRRRVGSWIKTGLIQPIVSGEWSVWRFFKVDPETYEKLKEMTMISTTRTIPQNEKPRTDISLETGAL